MKLMKSAAIAACMMTASHAAVVTVDTGFTIGVTNNAGVNLGVGAGSIRLGYFSTIADTSLVSTTGTALLTDFRTYGDDVAVFGKSGLSGFFAISANTGAKDFNSSFIGKNIYLLAFNTTSASPTEALVYKFTQTFQADPADPTPPSSQTPPFTLTPGNYLVGTPNSTLTGAVPVGAARMAVLIPEPSAALLGAVGALGLLRRRRN